MYENHTIGVVVPAYNEAGFVGDVLREQPAFVDRIYAVDDRSTDETWTEILSAARTDANRGEPSGDVDRSGPTGGANRSESPVATNGAGTSAEARASASGDAISENRVIESTGAVVHDGPGRVVPIRHRENRGVGGAIKTGYLQARADGMDVAVIVAGDGQMDPTQMPRLLDPIVDGRVDYAKGNRLTGDSLESMPTFRFVGNAVLTLLTRIASGYWRVTDPQNGYTAISRRALDAVDVESLYEDYGFSNELLVKLNVAGMRVGDVTMKPIYGAERSDIRYGRFVPRASSLLLRNYLWRLRAQHLSTGRSLGAGVLLGILGAAATALLGTDDDGGESADRSTALLWAVAGGVLLVAGMIADMRTNDGEVVIVDE